MPETSPEELILKTRGCGEQLCGIHVEIWGNVSAVIITRNIMLFTIWGVWPLNESTLGVLCQHPSECCSLARGLPAQHSHFPFNKIKIWFLLGNSIPLWLIKRMASVEVNRTHRWGWWKIQTLSFLDLGVVPSRCTGFQLPAFLEIQIEMQKQIHNPLSFKLLLSSHFAYFLCSSFYVDQQ